MIIGQAPGAIELTTGLPFSGRAGAELRRWLAVAGIDEAHLPYRTAITKCFPGKAASGAGDRRPSPAEVLLCAPWLEAELALVRPRVVLLVGTLAMLAFAAPAAANTIVVTTTADNPAVDGLCSLREAVVAATLETTIDTCVASTGGNTVVLGANTYSIKPSLGAIGVLRFVSVEGKGYKQTIIQQDASEAGFTSPGVFTVNGGQLNIIGVQLTKFRSRVLNVNNGATAFISDHRPAWRY